MTNTKAIVLVDDIRGGCPHCRFWQAGGEGEGESACVLFNDSKDAVAKCERSRQYTADLLGVLTERSAVSVVLDMEANRWLKITMKIPNDYEADTSAVLKDVSKAVKEALKKFCPDGSNSDFEDICSKIKAVKSEGKSPGAVSGNSNNDG